MEFPKKSFSLFAKIASSLATFAVAGAARGEDKAAPIIEKTRIPISWEADAEVSGVSRSAFRDRRETGDVDSLDAAVRGIASLQAKDGVLLRFGFEIERHSFGLPAGAALPDKLQGLHLVAGADLQLGNAWLVRFELQPGFYGDDADLRAKQFSYPMILGASYFVSSDLQLVAGVSFSPDRKYPVLPGVGFRWKVSSDWVINAVLPAPRIEYSFSKPLTLYAGADLRGETYRVNADFGRAHGIPELNNAVVDYSQIRVGAGASWKVNANATLELEAGCVVVDEFDFHRAEFKSRSLDAPPYGGISFKAAF